MKVKWIVEVAAHARVMIEDKIQLIEEKLGSQETPFDVIPENLLEIYAFVKSIEEYRTNLTMSGINQSMGILPCYHSVEEWERASVMETIDLMQATEDNTRIYFWLRLRTEMKVLDGEDIDIRHPNIVIKVAKKIYLAVDNTHR